MRPPVQPGHLAYLGGSLYHALMRTCRCLLCGAVFTGPTNGKYCAACKQEARRQYNQWRRRRARV